MSTAMANPPGNHLVPLGVGPVATVYAGGGAAYKVFPISLDRRTRTAVEREIARWRRVPFTPGVRGVEELADGVTAVVSELCRYSLATRVRHDGQLPVAEVLDLGRVLAEALGAAHAAGLVHGGVTATNVLFRASGEPVLADGGLAVRRAFPSDPPVDFAAPETVRDAVRDARTDLYGLGAVLYLALTGQVPYPGRMGERAEEHLLRLLGAPVPEVSRPDLPAGLADLVRGLLAREPDSRPVDVAARLAAIAGSGFDDFDDFADTPYPTPPTYFPTTSPRTHPAPPIHPPLTQPPTPTAPPTAQPFTPPPFTPPPFVPPPFVPPLSQPSPGPQPGGVPPVFLPVAPPPADAPPVQPFAPQGSQASVAPPAGEPVAPVPVEPSLDQAGLAQPLEVPSVPPLVEPSSDQDSSAQAIEVPFAPSPVEPSWGGAPFVSPPVVPPSGQVPVAPPYAAPMPASPQEPEGYFSVSPAPPVRMPIAEVKPSDKGDRRGRLGLVVGIVGALGLFAAAPILLLREDPPASAPVPPTVSAPGGEAAVQIELEVVGEGDNHVELAWRGPADLDYVVVVVPAGQPNRKLPESRDKTARVPIEPGRPYCFEVWGTDGDKNYLSQPVSIRGAVCKR
ncbi:protein kinase domain-containing protein [Saccharothrix sp. ALI-22-I]|uniref:protein kinase domain-containing protein n=1 Tax=Saccharothrix sp. ALI-22-I TaxID=1933778 RepID=UPI0015C3EE23|nr:protein kinase [Saccharothrix sp. ALI-22-I]